MTAIDVSWLQMDFFAVAAVMDYCAVAKAVAVDIHFDDRFDNSNQRKPMAAHNETSRNHLVTMSSNIVVGSSDGRRRSCVDDCKEFRPDRSVRVQAPRTIVERIEAVQANDFRVSVSPDADDASTVDSRGRVARRRAGGVGWASSTEQVIDLIQLMAATRDCRISSDRIGEKVRRTRSYFDA